MAAYEVLSNSKKRKIYDKYGEFGLDVLEKTGSYGLTDFMLNTRKQAWLILSLALFFATILSFPFLVTLKLIGKINWVWCLIFVPMWVFHVVMFGFIVLAAVIAGKFDDEDEFGESQQTDSQNVSGKSVYWWLALYPLLVSFSVGLCLKADGIVSWDWSIIFSPYFAFEALYAILKTLRLTSIHAKWPGGDTVLPLVPNAKLYLTYQELRWTLVRTVFAGAALLPFNYARESCFALGYILVMLCPIIDAFYWRAYKFAARESRQSEKLPSRMITAASFGIYIFGIMCLLSFLTMLFLRLRPNSSISWVWVFFPFLLVCGALLGSIILCVPCIFCCCLTRDNTMYDEENPAAALNGSPLNTSKETT